MRRSPCGSLALVLLLLLGACSFWVIPVSIPRATATAPATGTAATPDDPAGSR